jgi:O-antigen/teichoic acid export membrane protein
MSSTSERFAQLGKDSFVYGLGSMVSRIIGLFLFPVYTRVFSTADYGVIDIISTSVSLMTLLLSSSMVGTALSYYFYSAKDENDQRLTITTDLAYVIVANSLVGLVGWVFTRDLSHFLFQSFDYAIYLRLAVLSLPFSAANSLNANLFRLQFKPWHYFVLTAANLLLTVTMNIVLVVILRVGLIGVYWSNLITTALFALIGLWMNRTLLGWNVSWGRLEQLLAYGLPLVPASVAMWVINSLDRWFLTRYVGLENVGLYATGVRIGSAVAFVTQAFRTANAPHQFSMSQEEGAKQFYADTLKYYLLVLCFLGLGVSVFGREAIEVLSPMSYWSAYRVVPFIVFSAIGYGLYQLVGVGILLVKKTSITGAIILFAGLVHIALLFVFVPTWSYVGAGFVTLITHVGVILVLYLISQRVYPIPYPTTDVIKVVLVTAGLVSAGVLFDADSLIMRITFKIGLMLSYPVVLLLLSATSWSEIKSIASIATGMAPTRLRRRIQKMMNPLAR